jgi:flagellar biogenesis protein FliO
VVGAIEWLRTLAMLTATRMSMQQPWLRMTLILLAVAAFTAAAAWLLRRGTSRSA